VVLAESTTDVGIAPGIVVVVFCCDPSRVGGARLNQGLKG
jgi:hypothetical protein